MKHSLRIFLVLGAAMFCLGSMDEGTPWFSSAVMADTCMVGGVISSNTTWSTAECDTYVVNGNLLVDEGAALTIMPGVVVAFEPGYRIEIGGVLDARGTASDSIVFTGYMGVAWSTIKFLNSSIDTACILEYCRIERAQCGVYCDSAGPTISRSNVTDCSGDGIVGIYGSPQIYQSTITNTHGSGMRFYSGSPSTYGNVISGNLNDGIAIYAYNASPTFRADTIRQNGGDGISFGEWGSIDSATIYSCEISDHTGGHGIYINLGGNYLIRRNLISGNTSVNGGGIRVVAAGFALIDSNCIIGNWATSSGNTAGAIHFSAVDSATVQHNDIVGNSDFATGVHEVYSGWGPTDIQGQNNWWGTTNPDTVSYLIYDYYDDFELCKFIYEPFATSPHCEIWIELTAPTGGEVLCVDSAYEITWGSSGPIDTVAIEYSTDAGLSWMPVSESAPNTGSYSWTVPSTPSESCLIEISDAEDGDPADTSDSYFRIVPEPTIVVKSPNGGENWTVSSTQDVTWNSFCFFDSVIIEFTTNNGSTWESIMDETTNDGIYTWTIPDSPSDSCLVRISDVVDNIPSDLSDSFFSIVTWIRGDANGDGVINVADIVYLVNFLYRGGDPPIPEEAGDANCDGIVNVADVVYLVNYLYRGGDPPSC